MFFKLLAMSEICLIKVFVSCRPFDHQYVELCVDKVMGCRTVGTCVRVTLPSILLKLPTCIYIAVCQASEMVEIVVCILLAISSWCPV